MKDGSSSSDNILLELIEILFRNAPTIYITTLLYCLLVFFILRGHVETDYLLPWFCAMLFFVLLRLIVARLYWYNNGNSHRAYIFYYMYLLLMYCSALLWGLLIYLPLISDIIWLHAFISFVIAGMSAGAMVALSASLLASISYLILILIPFSYYFLAFNTPPHLAMNIMSALYLLLLIRLAVQINRIIRKTVTIKLNNEELYKFLKKTSKQAFYKFLEDTGQNPSA